VIVSVRPGVLVRCLVGGHGAKLIELADVRWLGV
jgi:hypothetical protein